MAIAKWIGGFLGWILTGSFLGGLAGFCIGSMIDSASEDSDSESNNRYNGNNTYTGNNQYNSGFTDNSSRQGNRNSFLFSMLVLASYIINADGRIMHSEMEFVRQFLRTNFGEAAVHDGEQILLKLFEKQKEMGSLQYRGVIDSAARQMAQNLDYAARLQLLNFLVIIAKADGNVHPAEVQALKDITLALGLSLSDLDSMLNLDAGANDLEAAYKVLGVSPSATDQEVKAAYRKLALQHHPDRVATLGDDVKRAAERKFKEINDAKEKIFKARGI